MSRYVRRSMAAASVSALVFSLMAAAPLQARSLTGDGDLAWVNGDIILALDPGFPDTGWLERAIEDPFTLREQVKPLDDFVRVCGPATGIGSMAVLHFEDEAAAARATSTLSGMPGVRFAQRDHLVRVPAEQPNAQPHQLAAEASDPELPNDPLFADQWNLRNTGQTVGEGATRQSATAGQDIRVTAAWAQQARGQGQVIAILDSGMNVNHPDLAANVWTNENEIAGNSIDDDGNGWVDDVHGWNYVNGTPDPRPWGHGVNVAGIAAATSNNGIGVSGVAPDAKLMSVDWLGNGDLGTVSGMNAMGAFAYAIANGATVINNSWGFVAPVGLGSPTMRAVVECARNADIVIAWSAGNLLAAPESWPGYYPADNVLLTTSFDPKGCHYLGAYLNPALVDVSAPGVSVPTTQGWDGYTWFGGTSAAAPHTAGVAALVRSLYPELSATQTALAIRIGARRDFIEPWTRSLGFLSAEGALEAARTGALVPELPTGGAFSGSVGRCLVNANLAFADDSVPVLGQRIEDLADAWAPGGWPDELGRPWEIWPGLPRG